MCRLNRVVAPRCATRVLRFSCQLTHRRGVRGWEMPPFLARLVGQVDQTGQRVPQRGDVSFEPLFHAHVAILDCSAGDSENLPLPRMPAEIRNVTGWTASRRDRLEVVGPPTPASAARIRRHVSRGGSRGSGASERAEDDRRLRRDLLGFLWPKCYTAAACESSSEANDSPAS